jgi:hypothetical protein
MAVYAYRVRIALKVETAREWHFRIMVQDGILERTNTKLV